MNTEVITLAAIMKFFKEDSNTFEKGEKKFQADHVLKLEIQDLDIVAKVQASLKDRSYKVVLTVDESGGIACAHCECPRGNWICSHMAATAIYANKKGLSKTDLPNSWIARPKKHLNQQVNTVSSLFPSNKSDFAAISREVSAGDIDFLFTDLPTCPLKWIIEAEPTASTFEINCPTLIEDILHINCTDKNEFIEKCKVTAEQIQWVAYNTKDQRTSHLWGKIRWLRLTGSNVGKVLAAYDRHQQFSNAYPPSLFKTLRGEYSLQGKDSIIWGQVHEKQAIEQYKIITGNQVSDIGLVLFECGYLGSTPDGIVTQTSERGSMECGVLEVKCPFKYQNSTVDEMIQSELKEKMCSNSFYLTKLGQMNTNHPYWHQVQGEMAATNLEWANFALWTQKDFRISRIQKCNNWKIDHLPKLKHFYLNVLLPQFYGS